MIERVSIMSTARDHSNIAPIFHPAESWLDENTKQFFRYLLLSFFLLASGAYLRLTEYNLIRNLSIQNWYTYSTFPHNFVLNNPYKDSANTLLALWTLIISVTLVTAFLETKTVDSSNTARAFYLFVCLLSCAISIITGYISPDMLNQYDFGLSLLFIIISVGIAAFALNYGAKLIFSTRARQENEMLRSDHLDEYQSLLKRSSVGSHPITDTILRPICGLILMTTLAAFIAWGIAALFAKMSNHPVRRIIILVIAVALELIPSLLDRFSMLQIGVYGQPSKKNQAHHKRRKIYKFMYRSFTAVFSWLISILFFLIVLNPTTTLMFVVTLVIPILIFVFYLLPYWDCFLAPIDKWLIKRIIKDDQENIERGHFCLYTQVALTYISSELSVDTHREHLLHTVITPTVKGDWAKICYPTSRDTKHVPLLSLSIHELQKTLEFVNSRRNNDINSDAIKRQNNITRLIDNISTNDPEFDCCNQEDCKIYLAAIFDDRQYLSTSISPKASKEERPQKVITHSFSSFKGTWQLILTLAKR